MKGWNLPEVMALSFDTTATTTTTTTTTTTSTTESTNELLVIKYKEYGKILVSA